ncbi:MAG: JAB domain-containing protein [Actinobacteria bacterium]|nr:JAB domain-containing protein [Actinomycetota bacterium]
MNLELLKVRDIAKGEPIRSPHDVAKFVQGNMSEEAMADRECFWILHLNARNQVIEKELTAIGCVNSCIVRPADVMRKAVINGTVAIIAVHNHPSGSPEPSMEDMNLTERLRKSSEILGIQLLDSVVIASGGKVQSIMR